MNRAKKRFLEAVTGATVLWVIVFAIIATLLLGGRVFERDVTVKVVDAVTIMEGDGATKVQLLAPDEITFSCYGIGCYDIQAGDTVRLRGCWFGKCDDAEVLP